MPTLYRKYRPQNFTEVVGQNHIKLTLEQEIKSGKIAHAYLFCGPRAVGKTTLARVLAKAVNCEKRKSDASDPCNKCPSCEEITAGRALDIIEIDAASHTGVDNVRENIIANSRVAPAKSKFKVFIIDEVHMLSINAFNALLKIIEEPPAYVVFILCTTEVHKVPTTIISRCQRFDFKRISVTDIVKKLNYIIKSENIKIDKTILETIARQSEGHMRDAESMLGQIVAIGGEEITQAEADLVIPRSEINEVINLINFLAKKDTAAGIRLVNKLIDEGVDLKSFLHDLIEILRKILLAKISPNLASKLALELGESLELKISQASQNLSINQILLFLEKFIQASQELKTSFIEQLPLELAIVELNVSASEPRKTWPVAQGLNTQALAPSRNLQNIKISAKPAADINITNDEIIKNWHEVLAKVKQYNHSLSFILRVCQPRGLVGNQLCLAFKYKFHKDRVSEPNIRALVEKVLNQVYGAPIMIEAIIDENLEASVKLNGNGNEKKDDNIIDNLLKTFGGKIVG